MGNLNGGDSSAVSMDRQTSDHDCGQPAACSSGAAPATKADTAPSTPSEIADRPTQKGSKLSVSVPSTWGGARKSFKKQVSLSGASQEEQGGCSSPRRRGASERLDTGETDVGHETREIVLSEANGNTKWYEAIERRDCKTLMELLRGERGSDWLLKTGKAGRTALHVAAIQGSLELVHAIESLPPGTVDVRTAQKLTDAIDVRCSMTASDIAVSFLGYKESYYFKVFAHGSHMEEYLQSSARLIDVWQCNYEVTEAHIESVEETITSVWKKGCEEGRYEGLMKSFEENVDYNFHSSRVFLVHHACSRRGGLEFIQDVFWKHGGGEQLKKLLELRDFQGRTPLHVAFAVTPVGVKDIVLELMMSSPFVRGDWRNWAVRDGRGWTAVHVAATQPWSGTLEFAIGEAGDHVLGLRICGEDSEERCTPLHLAVLHNNPEFASYIGRRAANSIWSVLMRPIIIDIVPMYREFRWSAFTLALLLGNEAIAQSDAFKSGVPEACLPCEKIPPICLAAAMGNTRVLRQLMNDSRFDAFERDEWGRTGLHYAAYGVIEPYDNYSEFFMLEPRGAGMYMSLNDVPNVAWLDARHGSCPPRETQNDSKKGLSGRQGCITMLLQGGLDMWQKDDDGRIAEPGVGITDDEFINWWHEKIAKETLEARNSLNQGGNAISVIGALIATASYVGPLQPPLNYGPVPLTSDNTGYAHVWDLPVKVFMLSNSLSFYLAIASIMLAVVPSLPMPQESVWKELERTRITVAWAICVLLLSVVGILVSYAAASTAVMPEHTSFGSVRWTSYPAVVGGFACVIGIVLFTIRVLRLMYPDKCRRIGKVWKKVGGYAREKVGRCVWEKVVGTSFMEMVHDGSIKNTWSGLFKFVTRKFYR